MRTNQFAINSPEWCDLRTDMFLQKGDLRNSPHEYAEAAKHMLSPVLEIGCCFGSFSAHLEPSMQYVGIDLSEKAIRIARSRFPHRLFFAQDVRSLPTEWPGVFNSTAIFQTLEHFEHPEEIIRILSRIGKRMIFTVPLGEQSAHQMNERGHCYQWQDMKAVAEMIKPFGGVTELPADIGHLMGVVTWKRDRL